MGFLGFGKKEETLLIEVMYEGPGRMRLNGNRVSDAKIRQRAINHDRTICWMEFASDGLPKDQGQGPAATKLGSGEAEQLLRDMRNHVTLRRVVEDLKAGRAPVSRWLQLADSVKEA